jgi:hypothetical protein
MSCSQDSVTLNATTLEVRVQPPAIRESINYQEKKRSRDRGGFGYSSIEDHFWREHTKLICDAKCTTFVNRSKCSL